MKSWIVLYKRKFGYIGRIASVERTKENLRSLRKNFNLVVCAEDKTNNLYLEVVGVRK